MKYKSIIKYDVANGPGLRTTIFFSGCTIHCKGCFNSELWNFNYGNDFDEETENKVIELLQDEHCTGLSILGGEPTDQGSALINFLRKVKKYNTNVWLWSGRELTEVEDRMPELFDEKLINVIVTGPFIEELKDTTLKFYGSSNQKIIYVKD